MPSFLEGDRKLTMESADHNLNILAEVVQDGYDILCSCPTCSFMLRHQLAEGAYYSREYQESAERTPSLSRCRPNRSPEKLSEK